MAAAEIFLMTNSADSDEIFMIYVLITAPVATELFG